MNKVFCSLDERFVNPLFEVFDGGDFILSSFRDIEKTQTEVQIFFPDAKDAPEAERRLADALAVVGADARIGRGEIPDEDWKLSYRRHFKTERIGRSLVVRPPWEPLPESGVVLTLDPGLAFGTGKHETTRACLEYVEELAPAASEFLDMGCGSGILSIAAAKLGCRAVAGFDVDPEAVQASRENAAANGVTVRFERFALGRNRPERLFEPAEAVVANILGPLLIRFADEIVSYAKRDLVISGILAPLYPEVLAAFTARGFEEVSRRTYGEWTTGLLQRKGI